MALPRTFTKKIYLDKIFNRATSEDSNHWIGTTLKAYRVLSTNNKAFDLSIVADPENGSIKGIPMGKVRLHNYESTVKNAVLENLVEQAGVWVEILFSVEDTLVWTGDDSEQPSTVVSEGSNHNSQKITMPINTVTELIPADDSRALATLQAKTGGGFWIGNPTELNDADWKNICKYVPLASLDNFEWRNAGALNGKFDSGADQVFSLMQEMK